MSDKQIMIIESPVIHAFGNEHGVKWSDDASDVYAQWLDMQMEKT